MFTVEGDRGTMTRRAVGREETLAIRSRQEIEHGGYVLSVRAPSIDRRAAPRPRAGRSRCRSRAPTGDRQGLTSTSDVTSWHSTQVSLKISFPRGETYEPGQRVDLIDRQVGAPRRHALVSAGSDHLDKIDALGNGQRPAVTARAVLGVEQRYRVTGGLDAGRWSFFDEGDDGEDRRLRRRVAR